MEMVSVVNLVNPFFIYLKSVLLIILNKTNLLTGMTRIGVVILKCC